MEGAVDIKLRETWDRLVLLIIAQPQKGWESEFEEIIRHEIERLNIPTAEEEGNEQSPNYLRRSQGRNARRRT